MSEIKNPPAEQQTEEQMASQPQNQKGSEIQQINPIILLKQPQLFKQTFTKITKTAQQLYKSKDVEKGLVFFNKALDMLDLGKHILKDTVSKYIKIVIFSNLAYGYQILRKLQKCNRFCERAKQELQRLILASKGEENSIEKYLKLSKFLITLKFQHCAIVSQLQQHEKALQMCKSTLPQLKQQIETMLRYLRQNSASKLLEKKTGETVQFSRHVQKFAESLLVDLLNHLNQPLRKFHFYYWEKNPQLNEEQVRKKFISSSCEAKNECKRSILGVNKSNSWMDDFNIGSIMHMSMVSVEDFEANLPMEEYFFKDKLYEIVILCSLSYFTMATQIRFIEPQKQKTESEKQIQAKKDKQKSHSSQEAEQKDDEDEDSKRQRQNQQNLSKKRSGLQILKKYGYEERSELHKLSQLYHLRSIEIYSKNIQSAIPYLTHIIKSYDKHYLKRKELQPIAAINEQSQLSLMNQSMKDILPQQKIYNDFLKKQSDKSKNQSLADELLLQSQDNHRSIAMSRNKSANKNSQLKNDDLKDLKNVLDFNSLVTEQQNDLNINTLNSNIMRAKKNLSKIIEDPKLQSEIHLFSKLPEDENEANHENEVVSGQYLKSKKQLNTVRSPKKSKNHQTKRTKSKSKLNLIKSREKQSSSTFKKNQKSAQKTIGTNRSPQEEKRPMSKSHYQTNHNSLMATHQGIIKKFHSPELVTINESKKRLKTQLSDRSRQKILKKFAGVPQNNDEDAKQYHTRSSKGCTKGGDKKPGHKDGQKKKQSKYFTTYDGQKQYRIKHESTTHIKVVYKKKNIHQKQQQH